MQEYTVKVIELIKQTPSATTIRMEKPEGFTFEPGQWGYFTLQDGQSAFSHPLSFSSSPTEPYLEFTKRISGSDFSKIVESFQGGEKITFSGPMGNLVYKGGLDKVTFIAGGIGITPIRSILKHAVDKGVTGEKFFLYGNHNVEDTAFADEIRQWEKADPGLKVVHVLIEPPADWTGYTGFINSTVIAESVPELDQQHFFISGPPPMVGAVTRCLDELGIDPGKVVKEELKGYETMV
jgi:ferredoxin-NADP reductase